MHSSLAVTTRGAPLGLTAVKLEIFHKILKIVLTTLEINLLDRISKRKKIYFTSNKNLTRGFRRLTDSTLGFNLTLKIVGN